MDILSNFFALNLEFPGTSQSKHFPFSKHCPLKPAFWSELGERKSNKLPWSEFRFVQWLRGYQVDLERGVQDLINISYKK